MKEILRKHPRFLQLLDQLCEQSLDQEGADEISRIVKSDPAARDYYIRYLEVHTSLYWDLAVPSTGLSSRDNEVEIQHSGSSDARLKQLVERFLDDAAIEPIGSSQNVQVSKDHSFATSATLMSRKIKWGLVSSGLVLVLILIGFWRLPEQSPQDQLTKKTAPSIEITQEKIVENKASQKGVEDDLPPKLPDIKWHHKPSSRSVADVTPDRSESLDAPKQVAALTNDDQVVSAINSRIEQGWLDQSLQPSPVAEDHEWVRRVYLDLAGRIPTPAEVEQFLHDKRPARERRLVDRLLESPEFAMNWSTRWTNLLVGRSPNERVDRLALLKYLRSSIIDNRPWSLVVNDLISAQGDSKKNGPANFLVAHLNNQAVPATAFVARTLLGTQIQCAQCHKHPFYETTQQQFWELNSFFKQAKVVFSPAMQTGNKKKGQGAYQLTDQKIGGPTYFETRTGLMRVAYPRFNGHKVSDDKSISRRQELAKLLTEGDDPLIAQAFVNRTWSHFFGYGFTLPIDDLGPHNPPSHPELFKILSRSFVANGYDIKRLVRCICLSTPYRLSSRAIPQNKQDTPQWGEPPAFARMYFKPLSPEQLYDSLIEISGYYPRTANEWNKHIHARESWVLQFVDSRDNDENDESNHFQGTITQALMMMNGELVNETISPDENMLTSSLVEATGSDIEKFESVCLAILSRKPTPSEIALFRKMTSQLREAGNPAERKQMLAGQLEDAMWAYLNSSEFIINH